jgi:hypothetical protein
MHAPNFSEEKKISLKIDLSKENGGSIIFKKRI